ncbi:MAG: hypothetical protein GY783_13465 [Gammaproteobacteria bacterium]|nr:hypothetical protein [Gammaproteobacteria bacterium]
MEFTYSISFEEPLVRVRSQGVFDYLKAYEMWKAVVAACNEYECYQILGESFSAEPIPTLDAYEHLDLIESSGVTRDYRIAWVSKAPAVLDRLRLIETLLRERSIFSVAVFENTAEAERWLATET